MDDREARDRVATIETLLGEIESLADPVARTQATTTVEALLDLYGEGLARIVSLVAERDGDGLAAAFAGDELIAHLLILHGLHPVPLEARVREALSDVRPYLESHGGNVELLGVEDGVARLRLQGSCSGCPSSAMTLKLAIEEAIAKRAPDVEAVEAEGAEQPESPLLQITVSDPVPNGIPLPQADAAWAMAGSLADVPSGATAVKEVAGEPVLFLRLERTPYAYRPQCPGCREPLEGATLRGAELTCAGCGHRYDVRRAGRCLDAPQLHLEPVPLLVTDAGLVKVALGAAVS